MGVSFHNFVEHMSPTVLYSFFATCVKNDVPLLVISILIVLKISSVISNDMNLINHFLFFEVK